MFYKLILLCLVFIINISHVKSECILKMTYKDGDKMPLIAKSPDNRGAYFELFSEASKRINCKLKIVRLPKARLHRYLKDGIVDFYPGASFSQKRAAYLYYFKNGFMTGEYGVTPLHIPKITNYKQVKELKLTWLMELASSKKEKAQEFQIPTQRVPFANLVIVRKMIASGRQIFYVADKELVDYYPKRDGFKSLRAAGLKLHKKCCGGEYPMYLGFSRFSKHLKEIPNPKFDKQKIISPTNFPTELSSNCVAYKLKKALQSLKNLGITDKIYQSLQVN